MKADEAATLVSMLSAAVMTRLTDDERAVWEEQFISLDADLATKAILQGRNVWKFFPSWADFKDAYRAQQRLSEPEPSPSARWGRGARSGPQEVPEWVWVWAWRASWPKEEKAKDEMKAFPAQSEWTKDPLMSVPEYEMLRDAWIAGGAPKVKVPGYMLKPV